MEPQLHESGLLEPLTQPTTLLDYQHASIQLLIDTRTWRGLPVFERIGAAYAFVRDEVTFGYNAPDDFYAAHGTNLSGIKRWLYQHAVRHWMNRNVADIRAA